MKDRKEPLSSADLEREAREKGRLELKESEAPGHTLPASETAAEPDASQVRPSMTPLPPD